MLRSLMNSVVFVFLVSPAAGVVVGTIIAALAFACSGEYAAFGASFGLPIGGFTGFIHGIAMVWAVRHIPLARTTLYLTVGTFITAFPFALIPEEGPFLSWLAGIVGCWAGLICLRTGCLDSHFRKLYMFLFGD